MNEYKVHMSSRPGHYAQYDGVVEVFASDDEDAVERAFRKLKATSFPDRSRSMWRVDSVERVFAR